MPRVAIVGHDYSTLVVVPEDLHATKKRSMMLFLMGRAFLEDCVKALIGNHRSKTHSLVPLTPEPETRKSFSTLFLRPNTDESTARVSIDRVDRIEPENLKLGVDPVTLTTLPPDMKVHLCVVFWNAGECDLPPDHQKISSQITLLHLAADGSAADAELLATRCKQLAKFLEGREADTVIVTSASALGHLRVPIQFEGSWEQFTDDLRQALRHGNGVSAILAQCRYLIVRCGDLAVAFVQHENTSKEDKKKLQLFYPIENSPADTDANAGFLIGRTPLLTSSIAAALAKGRLNERTISHGIRDGICRCSDFEKRGYAKAEKNEVDPKWHIRICKKQIDENTLKEKVKDVEVPTAAQWSIAGLCASVNSKPSDSKAREIAVAIVVEGTKIASHGYGFPVAEIGGALILERRECEQYFEMQATLRSYLRSSTDNKPLSLAVFGKPGGGKSFGVEQLAKKVGLRKDPIKANVSQFQSVDDLVDVLHRSRDVTLGGETPLVLWDEFDSVWDGRPFGWFRYFLAPMQDGTFQHGASMHKIGRSVFVFIGGVNHNFDMFEGRMRDQEFIEAKGPDFISRLRGHLNVLGISETEEGKDQTYALRRAVPLRAFLVKHQTAAYDPKSEIVRIDRDVLNAFLGVRDFKHGLRSMEAIVQMSRIASGQRRLTWASLPPPEQLETHVSVRSFQEARFKEARDPSV